jgi:hypothetical protein
MYTMNYFLAIKNETIWLTGKWVELEIILSKISQVQKNKG